MATSEQNLSDHEVISFKGLNNLRIGVVWADWNFEITNNLKQGAVDFLLHCNVNSKNIFEYKVPGSFELPLAAQWLIEKQDVDGVICLGSVIKGETDHFNFVCSAVSLGIKDVSLKTGKPVIFGVLTDNTKQQAIDRSGGKHGNKGIEAAATLLEMLKLSAEIS